MESVQIKGVITAIYPVEKKSENFTLQRFWVKETEGQYPNDYEVQSTGKTIGVLNDYKVGDNVVVSANVNGRQYTSKAGQQGIFMTLGLWKIERVNTVQATPQTNYQQFQQGNEAPFF